MAKPVQKRKAKSSRTAASVCWFDVPADDMGRAKKFYSSLFGWKFAKLSAAVADYWHIDTGGKDAYAGRRALAAHASRALHHGLRGCPIG